jgi:HAE1 family hydrophobic/amphiphilic exporter-1
MGMGEGDESQIPLGRAVIGGLFSSSFITLFVIPSVYLLFFRKSAMAKEQEKAIIAPSSAPTEDLR